MNPEFRRNVWLQLSPERLLVLPAVLALILTAVSAVDRVGIIHAPWYGAAVLGLLWGPRLAAASLLGEVAGRTWDWQRSSALTGWQMGWGKLFGATVYTWYGIGLCLAVSMTAALLIRPGGAHWLGAADATQLARDWGRLILCSVFGQAVALVLALVLLARGGEAGRANRLSAEVGGAIAGLAAFLWAGSFARHDAWSQMRWFDWLPGGTMFEAASLAFWAFWAVIGAWRLMARELQIPLTPWAWPTFVLSAAVWAAGTLQATEMVRILDGRTAPADIAFGSWQLRLYVAVGVAVIATWVAALADAKSPVQLRRFAAALRAARADQAVAVAPPWMLGLPVVAGLLAGHVAAWLMLRQSPGGQAALDGGNLVLHAPLAALSLVLFLARDIGLMYALAPYGSARRRVPTFVYLAILYGVLPPAVLALGADWLAAALVPWPSPLAGSSLSLVMLALQAVAGTFLAALMLRRVLGAQ